MNRFSSYLTAQKLAKLLLVQAEDHATKGHTDRAVRDIAKALREFMTATNCLASLAFEPRKKSR